MKKIFYLFGISVLFSCNTKRKEIQHTCVVTSCKAINKISIHDQMDPRTRYIVSTSCGNRKFTVYMNYKVGDTVKLTEIFIDKN